MDIKFIKRSLFQRIFGLPKTEKPVAADCWVYKEGKLIIDLVKTSELKIPGGAVRFEGKNLPIRILVVFGEDGVYRAFRNQCTHFGHRRLDPVPGTNTVQCCSINKSTFDSNGNNVFGPAPHAIHCHPLEKSQGKLTVLIVDQ